MALTVQGSKVGSGRGGLATIRRVRSDPMPVVTGLRADKHEVLASTVLDADPEHISNLPGANPWPFALAVVTLAGMGGLVYSAYVFWPLCLFAGVVLIAWYWHNSATERSGKGGF